MATATLPETQVAQDVFPINGTDYIEFYVGNAKQAAYFYRAAFGFELVGYMGPETGVRDRASYLLKQDKIRFVITTPITGSASPLATEIAAHIATHGARDRDRRAHRDARRRRARPRALGGRRARRVGQGRRAWRHVGARAGSAA